MRVKQYIQKKYILGVKTARKTNSTNESEKVQQNKCERDSARKRVKKRNRGR